jgi:hypothetical protein
MQEERVECSRCGATFASQDDLMVHSIDTHAGVRSPAESKPAPADPDEAHAGNGSGEATATGTAGDLDPETVEQLTAALEARSAPAVTAGYRQRFIAVASVAILAVALVLTYLHFTGVLDRAVFTFALGTLFGLTLSYLQVFLRTVRG